LACRQLENLRFVPITSLKLRSQSSKIAVSMIFIDDALCFYIDVIYRFYTDSIVLPREARSAAG
jgi:hypothetical protein